MVARDGAELQHDSASTQSWMVSGACLDRTNSAIKAQGGPMLNELQALRKLVIANGGSNAERLNELECLQAWARLKGVQNTAWKNELDCLRALVVANGGPNAEHLNEVQCLRKLANLAGCAPVENLLETDLYNVLLNPQQFIFNKQYVSAPSIQSLTNAQKLSLPANTPVGTRVQITDGFVVAPGFFDQPGLYIVSTVYHGKPSYAYVDNPNGSGGFNWSFRYDGSQWNYYQDDDAQDFPDNPGDVEGPWLAEFGQVADLTHPAVQQLAAPSTEQGAVFVSGGTLDGICTKRGTFGGRDLFVLLGMSDSDTDDAFVWESTQWTYYSGAEALYYSLSNVATPDLASNWKNASDDSPASITVTSVAQGKLDAGVQVTGAGTSSYNAPYSNRGISGSKAWFFYNKVGEATTDPDDVPPAHCIARDEDEWIINGVVGVSGYATEDDPNPYWFPFDDPVYVLQSGSAPAPTVTRNDVCAEANWINI